MLILAARQANAQTNINNRQAAQVPTLLRANGGNLRAIAAQLNRAVEPLGLHHSTEQGLPPHGRPAHTGQSRLNLPQSPASNHQLPGDGLLILPPLAAFAPLFASADTRLRLLQRHI
jgi:hypothetical protein